MDRLLSRRHLLAALATGCCATSPLLASSLDTVPLYPDDSHSMYRVRAMLDVAGNAEVPKNELANNEVRKIGVKSESVIDYEERLMRDGDGLPKAARRYYYEASTKGKIQTNEMESGLRDECRRAILQLDGSRSVLYGENSLLTNDELELLRLPVNSLAIDRLLPYKSLKKGAGWEIPMDILAELFDMDAIQKSTIKATLTGFDDTSAKAEMAGGIEASIDGVPTSIRLRGKLTFDRKQRCVSWLAIALREDREIGKAEPGFEVAAQIRIIRQAMPKPNAVKNSTEIDITEKPTSDKLMIDARSEEGGFSVYSDRGWRVMNANDRSTMMRLIENDNVIAQCDVRAMPELKDGHQLTLEALQEDIKRTIGSRFEEYITAEEKLTGNGIRMLRVIAQGSVENIPVQWIYLHFSNDQGRRSAAIFTVADKQLETFAGDDLQFAEGFRFIDLPEESSVVEEKQVAQSEPESEKPAEEVAEVPQESGVSKSDIVR